MATSNIPFFIIVQFFYYAYLRASAFPFFWSAAANFAHPVLGRRASSLATTLGGEGQHIKTAAMLYKNMLRQ
jgi:hypothetical protein